MRVATLIVFLSLLITPNFTFLADWTEGLFVSPTSLWHTTITRYAIKRVVVEYFNSESAKLEKPLKNPTINVEMSDMEIFSTYLGGSLANIYNYIEARDEIENANAHVDKAKETKDHPYYHFDAEKFIEANEVVKGKRIATIAAINDGNHTAARQRLGEALHTIQDFYAHSNWVEMGKTEPNLLIGLIGVKPFPRIAASDQPTCTDCRLDSIKNPQCHDNIIPEINENEILTSGYYVGESISANETVPKPKGNNGRGKCSHGNFLDKTRFQTATGGISKDADNRFLAPHSYLHFQAAKLAEDATFAFLKGLQNDTSVDQFREVLGLSNGYSLTIVFDKSSDEFVQKAKPIAIDLVKNSQSSGVSKYILTTYNSTAIDMPFVTGSTERMLLAIDKIYSKVARSVDPTNNCFMAIKQSVSASLSTSNVFVFAWQSISTTTTDFRDTISVVNGKHLKVSVFGSDDRSLRGLVKSTGGFVLTNLLLNTTATKIGKLLSTGGNVNIAQMSGSTQTVQEFPVETNIHMLTVSVMSDSNHRCQYALFSPEGTQVQCESLVELETTSVCSLSKPTSGVWQLSLVGNSSCTATVAAKSSLDVRCKLYEKNSANVYLIPHVGDMKIGSTLYLKCHVSDDKASITKLIIYSHTGNNSFPISYEGPKDHLYVAKFVAQLGQYKYKISGTDSSGAAFQRFRYT